MQLKMVCKIFSVIFFPGPTVRFLGRRMSIGMNWTHSTRQQPLNVTDWQNLFKSWKEGH